MNTNETRQDVRPLAVILGSIDHNNREDVYTPPNSTMARVKPPTPVSEPVYIDVSTLEAMQEIEQAKRRERVELFRSRNW